ncbi:MAG: enoyl-CoA hydratase [Rhizobiales bacterium]|nr:enoyl-CoA hydratase [Hyphomicrobiales bacterium]
MSVELTRQGEVSILMLRRPEALNALSFRIIEQIGAALDEVETDDSRFLIITGEGERAFCAGADIKELREATPLEMGRRMRRGQQTFGQLDRLRVPSLALINGYAFGGGLELALACTFRMATPNAKVGLPEIKLGLIPGYGGTQRLPRLVGEGRAMEMITTGRPVAAEEALAMGLVQEVIEGDPMTRALEFADQMGKLSLPVLGFAREAVSRALDRPLEAGFEAEANLNNLGFQLNDSTEGMAAFEEKRDPEFKDT